MTVEVWGYGMSRNMAMSSMSGLVRCVCVGSVGAETCMLFLSQ